MEEKKPDTEELLINSFKKLFLDYSFGKITIKMITDEAEVIRPTFYNYFQDKSAVFDLILEKELFSSIYDLVEIGMTEEAFKMVFTYFDKYREFYQKAFDITGQNSFEETLWYKFEEFFLDLFEQYTLKDAEGLKVLTNKNVADYYTMSTIFIIRRWVTTDGYQEYDVDDMMNTYKYLITHSIWEIFE